MKPLSLTDTQMNAIRKLVRFVPHDSREQFFEHLADALMPYDVLDDALVAETANTIIHQMIGWKP